MIQIDNRNIFFDKLSTGINIFLGAGFSTLPDNSGTYLPTASDLASELCSKFNQNIKYAADLEKLSSILKRNCKKEFEDYLRLKFTLKDYNPLYDVINKIQLTSIITTNIDNLIPLIMDKSDKYYLNCVSYYGPAKKDGKSVPYIPLHGDVLNPQSELYFGKFELCNASNCNRGLFSMMQSELLENSTLFCGYGFHDGSVSGIINEVLSEGKNDIWIQLLEDSVDIDFFRELGCNVIIGNTEDLLNEINIELSKREDYKPVEVRRLKNSFWEDLAIPSINQVESVSLSDFYEQGKTLWYYALTGSIYITSFVNTVINELLENKNTIVVGMPLGGKTTILMQVACKINKTVYFVSDLNEAKAKLICNNANKDKEEFILLVDNCSEDMYAYKRLAECPFIRTIGTSEDIMYESSKHILEGIEYKKIDIPELDINEASRIYEKIPSDIKVKNFIYKQNENEKYSVLEFVSANVKNVLSEKKVEECLNKIKCADKEVFEVVLLTAYLSYYKSALTTDILYSYYGLSSVNDFNEKIQRAQTYLSDINMSIYKDMEDQDYFTLRSSLFVQHAHSIARNKYKKEYGDIIKKFVREIQPCLIYKDYVFKRGAYDAGLFFDVFGDSADEVYDIIYRNDSSAYTLQQWALYKAHINRFSEAFSYIDKAIHMQPNNFSVKNARAIILFEANKDKNTVEANNSFEEAMRILENCYFSDKRKVYHAQKYAEFALKLYEKNNNTRYLKQAYSWLEELIKSGESISKKTKKLFNQLKDLYGTINYSD